MADLLRYLLSLLLTLVTFSVLRVYRNTLCGYHMAQKVNLLPAKIKFLWVELQVSLSQPLENLTQVLLMVVD